MICNENHRYNPSLEDLPDDQSGSGRHKCAGCAYELGIKDGLNQNPIKDNFDKLPESQAGTGRHKDVKKAYLLGYKEGTAKRTGACQEKCVNGYMSCQQIGTRLSNSIAN